MEGAISLCVLLWSFFYVVMCLISFYAFFHPSVILAQLPCFPSRPIEVLHTTPDLLDYSRTEGLEKVSESIYSRLFPLSSSNDHLFIAISLLLSTFSYCSSTLNGGLSSDITSNFPIFSMPYDYQCVSAISESHHGQIWLSPTLNSLSRVSKTAGIKS